MDRSTIHAIIGASHAEYETDNQYDNRGRGEKSVSNLLRSAFQHASAEEQEEIRGLASYLKGRSIQAAANLTPGDDSAMLRYDAPEKFVAMIRTGKRPDNSAVSSVMPFPTLKNMSDTELGALYVYLKTLPPRPAGNR